MKTINKEFTTERLNRQELFRPFISEKESKFRDLRVLIVGGGTAGIPVLLGLSMSGAATGEKGNISIMDGDTVSLTNLNRLLFAGISDIGNSKSSVHERIKNQIAPDANIDVINNYLDINRIDSITDEVKPDIIVDACDNLSVKAALGLYCYNNNIAEVMFTDLHTDIGISFYPNNNLKNGFNYSNNKLFNGKASKEMVDTIISLDSNEVETNSVVKTKFTTKIVGLKAPGSDMLNAFIEGKKRNINHFPQAVDAPALILSVTPRLFRRFSNGEYIKQESVQRTDSYIPYMERILFEKVNKAKAIFSLIKLTSNSK